MITVKRKIFFVFLTHFELNIDFCNQKIKNINYLDLINYLSEINNKY